MAKPKRKCPINPKAYKVTPAKRKLVAVSVSLGSPHGIIAEVMKISRHMLEKYYKHELEHGAEICNDLIAKSLFRIATGNGPSAAASCMFWLKTRCGWKETIRQEFAIENASDADLIAIVQRNLPRYQEVLRQDQISVIAPPRAPRHIPLSPEVPVAEREYAPGCFGPPVIKSDD